MDNFKLKVAPHLEFIKNLLLKGSGDAEISRRLGISRSSLARYRKKYPDFDQIFTDFRQDYCDRTCEQVEEALLRRATGYDVDGENPRHIPPDVRAAMFWLKNRRPDQWKEHQDQAQSAALTIRLLPEEEQL